MQIYIVMMEYSEPYEGSWDWPLKAFLEEDSAKVWLENMQSRINKAVSQIKNDSANIPNDESKEVIKECHYCDLKSVELHIHEMELC